MLAVHLDGTFYGTRAAARSMQGRGGAIVNIASVCGVEGCVGYPHYSAAKAGVIGFTRSVAKELAPHGIHVNAVAPGFLETAGTGIEENALRTAQRVRTPLGRFGRREEIAATVEFLVSDAAGFFIGETLNVNGGLVTT
jgi:3-oxoacyl-[acyl-carrier protein] reductase